MTFAIGGAMAQQTWIVDRTGGPGSQFTSVAAAVAATAAGDTILIRAGTYSETVLDIDRGIHIVGDGGVTLRIGGLGSGYALLHDLPAGQVFSLTNVELDGLLPAPLWSCRDCDGLVVLSGVRARLGSSGFFLGVQRCAQLSGEGLFCPQHSVSVVDSSVALTGCAFEGALGGCLGLLDATVWLDDCALSGSTSPFLNGPAVIMTGGALHLTRSSLRVGPAPSSSAPPVAAVTTTGGRVLLDPTVTFVTAGNAAPVTGTAALVQRELAGLALARTVPPAGGLRVTAQLLGPAGAVFATLLSFPAPTLPTPVGEVWLDPNDYLTVTIGALPASRTDDFTVDLPALPAAFHVALQSVLYDGEPLLSNPVVF